MRKLRTLTEFTEDYFCQHPDEIENYLAEIFADFAEDKDTGALLTQLRLIARVRGVGEIAYLDLLLAPTNNPWLAIAGKYQDDPNWDEYQAAIAAARQAANESEGILNN